MSLLCPENVVFFYIFLLLKFIQRFITFFTFSCCVSFISSLEKVGDFIRDLFYNR